MLDCNKLFECVVVNTVDIFELRGVLFFKTEFVVVVNIYVLKGILRIKGSIFDSFLLLGANAQSLIAGY